MAAGALLIARGLPVDELRPPQAPRPPLPSLPSSLGGAPGGWVGARGSDRTCGGAATVAQHQAPLLRPGQKEWHGAL